MSKDDHGHDHSHEHDDEDDGTVTLVDADGNEATFGILDFVEVDDKEYALLAPIEQLEDEDEDAPLDVFIYRYEEFDDGEVYSAVEGEEFEKARAAAELALAQDGDDEDDE
ncbi:MAG: DUF1292 domain-containing protein [Alphaproteobacteria bacterium]|nr:DUF1292 domain-containing protein [Alphaproteobacteria bacterium]MCB9794324.1 DUF1292 domain-containing protein [Alphaproteobacteria bacterium]